MEWGNFPKQKDSYKHIENMIDFLVSYSLKPYGNGNVLFKQDWLSWPWDIIWKKDDLRIANSINNNRKIKNQICYNYAKHSLL